MFHVWRSIYLYILFNVHFSSSYFHYYYLALKLYFVVFSKRLNRKLPLTKNRFASKIDWRPSTFFGSVETKFPKNNGFDSKIWWFLNLYSKIGKFDWNSYKIGNESNISMDLRIRNLMFGHVSCGFFIVVYSHNFHSSTTHNYPSFSMIFPYSQLNFLFNE